MGLRQVRAAPDKLNLSGAPAARAQRARAAGFYLHTKSFTDNEVYRLAGILHYKFDLDCTVQFQDTKYPIISNPRPLYGRGFKFETPGLKSGGQNLYKKKFNE